MLKSTKRHSIIFLVACLLAAGSHAAITVDISPASGPATVTITEDITFNVTTDGNAAALVFVEWVTADADQDSYKFSSLDLDYRLNGGSVLTYTANSNGLQFFDNFAASAGDVSNNDGYIFLNGGGISLTSGDSITILAQSWTTTGGNTNAGEVENIFNPQVAGINFEGGVFLMDGSGNSLTPTVNAAPAIPEPSSSALLLSLAALGFAIRRRK